MTVLSHPPSSNASQVPKHVYTKGAFSNLRIPGNHLHTPLGDLLSPLKHSLPQAHPQIFTTIISTDIPLLIRVTSVIPAATACSRQVLGIHLDVAETTQLRKNARCSNNRCYSYLFLFWQLIKVFIIFSCKMKRETLLW